MKSKDQNTKTDSTHPAELQGDRSRWIGFALFFCPLAVVALADLSTKHYIFEAFYPSDGEPYWWIEGVFGIQTATNPGALFGLGKGRHALFAAMSLVIFVVLLAWLFFFGGWRDRWLTFAFGMICGGIFGNFYDRVGWGYEPGRPLEIRYHVRDWILFHLEGVPGFSPWPNFNIADAALVTGAIMLFVHSFIVKPPNEATTGNEVAERPVGG